MTVCVSIIVPVYNKEDYIEKTIQSVINQSNPDWELLLIDDGSTDNSTAICEQYSANDKRVILLKKENGGVSSARNFGLDNACGEFVMFLDADDTLDSDAVQMMSENIKEADLVVCSMKCLDGKTISPVESITEYSSVKDTLSECVYLYRNAFYNSPCNKLYRKKIIQSKFDETICHGEDLLFNLDYFKGCGKIIAIPDILYYYDTGVDASLSKGYYLDIDIIRKCIFDRIFEVLGDHKKVREIMSYDFTETFVVQTKRLMSSNLTKVQKRKIIRRWTECSVLRDYRLEKSYVKNFKHRIVLTLYQLRMVRAIMIICK